MSWTEHNYFCSHGSRFWLSGTAFILPPFHLIAKHPVVSVRPCASTFPPFFSICFFASIGFHNLQTRTLNNTVVLNAKVFYLSFNLCIRISTRKIRWELCLNLYLNFPIPTFFFVDLITFTHNFSQKIPLKYFNFDPKPF